MRRGAHTFGFAGCLGSVLAGGARLVLLGSREAQPKSGSASPSSGNLPATSVPSSPATRRSAR